MPSYTIRRLIMVVPTLLGISLVIFLLLDLAPGDPMAQLPLTIPPEVRDEMRRALGLDASGPARFGLWLWQFFWVEPLFWADAALGTDFVGDAPRVLSWQTRAPVMDTVIERLPQTLWVVGLGYLVGVGLALPIAVLSAWRQHSVFDRAGTLFTMVGYAVPPFFSGVLLIVVFSVWLGWLPSVYDTTLAVTDWGSAGAQLRQMILPVAVLALQTMALAGRYMRAAMLDALGQDYVLAARAKGLTEARVVLVHALRNSLSPMISVMALGAPQIFGGAVITEQIFGVNGVGQLLITSIAANDLPMVQTIVFLLAVLIVLANLIADLIYSLLDPRVRYD